MTCLEHAIKCRQHVIDNPKKYKLELKYLPEFRKNLKKFKKLREVELLRENNDTL